MSLQVGIVGFIVMTVAGAIARWRWARIAKQPVSDDACVACDSSSLTVVQPGMYVCNECGYEGGSMRAEHERTRAQHKHAALPQDERRRIVTDHIRTATRILSNYDGEGMVMNAVVDSLRVRGGDEGIEESPRAVAMQINEAVGELRRAATLAGGHVVLSNGVPVDVARITHDLETAQDSLIGAVRMRTVASAAHRELRSLLGTAYN